MRWSEPLGRWENDGKDLPVTPFPSPSAPSPSSSDSSSSSSTSSSSSSSSFSEMYLDEAELSQLFCSPVSSLLLLAHACIKTSTMRVVGIVA